MKGGASVKRCRPSKEKEREGRGGGSSPRKGGRQGRARRPPNRPAKGKDRRSRGPSLPPGRPMETGIREGSGRRKIVLHPLRLRRASGEKGGKKKEASEKCSSVINRREREKNKGRGLNYIYLSCFLGGEGRERTTRFLYRVAVRKGGRESGWRFPDPKLAAISEGKGEKGGEEASSTASMPCIMEREEKEWNGLRHGSFKHGSGRLGGGGRQVRGAFPAGEEGGEKPHSTFQVSRRKRGGKRCRKAPTRRYERPLLEKEGERLSASSCCCSRRKKERQEKGPSTSSSALDHPLGRGERQRGGLFPALELLRFLMKEKEKRGGKGGKRRPTSASISTTPTFLREKEKVGYYLPRGRKKKKSPFISRGKRKKGVFNCLLYI